MYLGHTFNFFEPFINPNLFDLSQTSSTLKLNIICGIESTIFSLSFVGLGTIQTALSYLAYLDFVDEKQKFQTRRYIAVLGYGLLIPFVCSLVCVLLGGVNLQGSGMCWIKSLGGYPNIMSVISYIIYVWYMFKLKNEIKNVLKIIEHPESVERIIKSSKED